MASQGHLLVPKAMRMVRLLVEKTGRIIRDKLPQTINSIEAQTQPVYARIVTKQPLSRAAAIKQSQSRWYSTKQAITNSIRHFSSEAVAGGQSLRSAYPPSRTAFAVGRLTTRTPFASALRPNLTGGTLSRTAGGYSLGGGRVGGARYFSHTPAAPAQVVTNVSQAVRAFWLSGTKARFDGVNARTGEKRYRAVSDLQENAAQKLDFSSTLAKGSFIDFKVNPTITAIGPLSTVPRQAGTPEYENADTLNNPTLISNLSVDFARALKDLAAIMNDLKRLSVLGELLILLHNSTTLRVRFPGCDADTVEGLCQELNIRRGIVGQDEGFDIKNGTEMALRFPFAPSKSPSETFHDADYARRPSKKIKREHVNWHEMLSETQLSVRSRPSVTSQNHGFEEFEEVVENPWISSPSGYSSLHASELGDDVAAYFEPQYRDIKTTSKNVYEGIEGIYKFIEECDRARR